MSANGGNLFKPGEKTTLLSSTARWNDEDIRPSGMGQSTARETLEEGQHSITLLPPLTERPPVLVSDTCAAELPISVCLRRKARFSSSPRPPQSLNHSYLPSHGKSRSLLYKPIPRFLKLHSASPARFVNLKRKHNIRLARNSHKTFCSNWERRYRSQDSRR